MISARFTYDLGEVDLGRRALLAQAGLTGRLDELMGRLMGRAARLVRAIPPLRLSGMVHIYVEPSWRGAARGAQLVRSSMEALRADGVTYVLTLADDGGSGRLRQFYEQLGFVDGSAFDDTAMFARL